MNEKMGMKTDVFLFFLGEKKPCFLLNIKKKEKKFAGK